MSDAYGRVPQRKRLIQIKDLKELGFTASRKKHKGKSVYTCILADYWSAVWHPDTGSYLLNDNDDDWMPYALYLNDTKDVDDTSINWVSETGYKTQLSNYKNFGRKTKYRSVFKEEAFDAEEIEKALSIIEEL